MEEGDKKPGAGMTAGGPDRKIVYAVIVIAVVILAVVLVAKLGFSEDLLNPSFGEMAIAKQRLAVTPVRTLSSQPSSDIAAPILATTTPAEVTTTPATPTHCGSWSEPTFLCSGVCTNIFSNPYNCGGCGIQCAAGQACNIGHCYTPDLMSDTRNCGRLYHTCPTPPHTLGATCYQGECSFSACEQYHRFCNDYTEGCVPLFNDKDHCGSCDMKCSADQWCNITHCESGSMPGNCGYINCKMGFACSHKQEDGTPECIVPRWP